MLRSRPHHGAPAGRAPAAAANPRPAAPRAPPTAASPPMAAPRCRRAPPLRAAANGRAARLPAPPSPAPRCPAGPITPRSGERRPSAAPIAASLGPSHAPPGVCTAPQRPGQSAPAASQPRGRTGCRLGHAPERRPMSGERGAAPSCPARRHRPGPAAGTGQPRAGPEPLPRPRAAPPGPVPAGPRAHGRRGPGQRGGPSAARDKGHPPARSPCAGPEPCPAPQLRPPAPHSKRLWMGEQGSLTVPGESSSGSQGSPQGKPRPSAPATVTDHSLVRQKCFNGPSTKPTTKPRSVDHQAAADRRQELEEALEGERPSGWAEQGHRQRGQAAAPCPSVTATRREQHHVAIETQR